MNGPLPLVGIEHGSTPEADFCDKLREYGRLKQFGILGADRLHEELIELYNQKPPAPLPDRAFVVSASLWGVEFCSRGELPEHRVNSADAIVKLITLLGSNLIKGIGDFLDQRDKRKQA